MTRYSVTGRFGLALALVLALLGLATPAAAQVAGIPALSINEGANGSTYSLSLQILALMTALTLLPSLVLGMTSFTRIIIVLSILRQAMGTQQTPPNQVLVAIALFLTFFIMAPTFTTLNSDVISPYLDGQLSAETALANGTEVMKRFLVQNTRVNDLVMFTEMIGDQPLCLGRGCAAQRSSAGFHHLRTEDSVSDWLPAVPALPRDRHGHCLDTDVARYDDAEPDAGGAALQAAAFRSC